MPEILMFMGAYIAIGLAFAIPFVCVGVAKIDPAAAKASIGFKLLIVPGCMVFWPLLMRRWWRGAGPAEEWTSHRCRAQER